ncbi:MAG: GspE/PulE/PilB domain-containing protein [Planctomycetota bacterium]
MAKIPPVRELKGRTLGRILIKMRLLTRDKVHKCLAIQKQKGGKLGQIFIEQGFIKPSDLRIALAGQRGMEYVDVNGLNIPKDIQERVPSQMARTYEVIPLQYDKTRNELTVAMKSPDNFRALDDLSTLMGYKVVAKVADEDSVKELLDQFYAEEDASMSELIGELEADGNLAQLAGRDASIDLDDIKGAAESTPVIKLLNQV